MLPYLIQISNGWQEYANKINQFDEKDFFPLYKVIAECAENAGMEDICDNKYNKNFSNIEYSYKDKMDVIVGADFTLKIEDE